MPAITYVKIDGEWKIIKEIHIKKDNEHLNIKDGWVNLKGTWVKVFDNVCTCDLRTCDCFARTYCDSNIGCDCENREQSPDICECNYRSDTACKCQTRSIASACTCNTVRSCTCQSRTGYSYAATCGNDCYIFKLVDASYCDCNTVYLCTPEHDSVCAGVCNHARWVPGLNIQCDCNGRTSTEYRSDCTSDVSECSCRSRTAGTSKCECDNRISCTCENRVIEPICTCNLRDNCSCVTRTTCDNNNVCSCESRGSS